MTDINILRLTNYHSKHWFEPGSWTELLLVGAAVKLEIFETLAVQPSTADVLAKTLHLDPRGTGIILSALAAAGYTTNDKGGVFALSGSARKYFGSRHSPDYLGWTVLHNWRLAQRWTTLPQAVESGKAVAGDRFSESIEGFARAMNTYAAPIAGQTVDVSLARRPQARHVLDIGGATGTVSKEFYRRGLTATLFDLPQVVEAISAEIAADFPGMVLAGGDFNDSIPSGPFDLVHLGNVAHIYGPAQNRRLFMRVFDSLSTGGLAIISDFVRDMSPSGPFFGVNMLVNTEEGDSWTKVQYQTWLEAAGFGDFEFLNFDQRDQQLILAAKPSGR